MKTVIINSYIINSVLITEIHIVYSTAGNIHTKYDVYVHQLTGFINKDIQMQTQPVTLPSIILILLAITTCCSIHTVPLH